MCAGGDCFQAGTLAGRICRRNVCGTRGRNAGVRDSWPAGKERGDEECLRAGIAAGTHAGREGWGRETAGGPGPEGMAMDSK